MIEPYIALGTRHTTLSNIPKNGIALVHEAAHAKQYLNPDFSELWLDKFPIEGRRDNDVASRYATKNYADPAQVSKDSIRHVRGDAVARFTPFGMPVLEFYNVDRRGIAGYYSDFRALFNRIPEGLRECLPLIKIDGDLNRAYFRCSDKSKAFKLTAEDVGEMTVWSMVAGLYPSRKKEFIRILDEAQLARDRVRVLTDNGYIDSEISDRLLDPEFRREILN